MESAITCRLVVVFYVDNIAYSFADLFIWNGGFSACPDF